LYRQCLSSNWHRNGSWKRTEITSDAVVHNRPTVHTDSLTQTIDYRVPPPLIGAVAEFDGSVPVDRTRGEVSGRCDSEAANVLGLNMVHERATGNATSQAHATPPGRTLSPATEYKYPGGI
jgi:hypothetical protein